MKFQLFYPEVIFDVNSEKNQVRRDFSNKVWGVGEGGSHCVEVRVLTRCTHLLLDRLFA